MIFLVPRRDVVVSEELIEQAEEEESGCCRSRARAMASLTLSSPAQREIQYAAASRSIADVSGILGHPLAGA